MSEQLPVDADTSLPHPDRLLRGDEELRSGDNLPGDEKLRSDEELWAVAKEVALALPATEIYTFAPEWDAVRVRGKWFLITTQRDARIINVKVDPAAGEALCAEFPSITPGYHMNKRHWVSLRPGADVTAALVRELVTESYLLVVGSLPRRLRPVDPASFLP